MKICFAMIVFQGEFFLKEVLDSIYDHADQIVINHGCTRYWQDRGFTTSTDKTGEILSNYPDPRGILSVVNVNGEEKTELCSAFMPLVKDDINYLWCIDSDEVFTGTDIEAVRQILLDRKPHSLSFKSRTFFGGFSHYLTGFEREVGFKRVLKYEPRCKYVTHRAPTLSTELVPNPLHLSCDEIFDKYGIEMFHYSYVSPRQVREKISYYQNAVIAKGSCIENYFEDVWLNWVNNADKRAEIEKKHGGTHEFVYPRARGECYPTEFRGEHPRVIQEKMPELIEKFYRQLNEYA